MAKDFVDNYKDYANKEAVKRMNRHAKTIKGWISQLGSDHAVIYCENDGIAGKTGTMSTGKGNLLIESIAQIIINIAKSIDLNPRDLLVCIESQIILKMMHKDEEK